MDEYQHYEKFGLDNDYEEHLDVDGEILVGRKRQRRAQTRDDQILGVFADGSDSDEEGRRGRRKGQREQADYSKPVEFVSTGLAAGSKPPGEQAAQPQAETAAALSTGLGFQPAQAADPTSDDEDQASLLPSAFGQRCAGWCSCCCLCSRAWHRAPTIHCCAS